MTNPEPTAKRLETGGVMMKRKLCWWIKDRMNPQLGRYFVGMGQLSKAAAKRHESGAAYGDNVMLPFETEREYLEKLEDLRASGEKVQ